MTAKLILTKKETYDSDYPTISLYDAEEAMIEFAKLHVKKALKEASEKSFAESSRSNITSRGNLTCIHLGEVSVNKDSILNAYPLSNIV